MALSMRSLGKLPIFGPFLLELISPHHVTYRRYGDREDRDRRLTAQGLVFLTVLAGLAYLQWVASAVDWTHPVAGLLFVGAEVLCFVLFLLASAGAWRIRYKPEETSLAAAPVSVDVFVTVCGEPLEVVRRTLTAVARLTWRGALQVYVLDDGGCAEVATIARGLGFIYRSRPGENLVRSDAKAGNLNFGLSVSGGEYVLALDADQVPAANIIERLAPYASLPRVAFVQSKQSFLVPEGDPFYCQDLVFYNSLQSAFDTNDTVLSCGSGVLYRRAALQDIGGFVTWNLVEDLTTSYELHCRGWKSLYYPFSLSTGLAPETLAGVYKQRGQWALDTMRLFFWRNPLTRRTLPWAARLNYWVIGFSYLTAGFVAPLFYMFPLWSYVTGQGVLIGGRELEFALWRTIYFITMTLAIRWLFRGQQPGRQFQMLVGLFPVYAGNTLRALRYRRDKPTYHVNNVTHARRARPDWLLVLPQLTLLAANAVGPFLALALGSARPELIVANVCVSAMAIWSLSHVCISVFAAPTWHPERHPAQFYAPTI